MKTNRTEIVRINIPICRVGSIINCRDNGTIVVLIDPPEVCDTTMSFADTLAAYTDAVDSGGLLFALEP